MLMEASSLANMAYLIGDALQDEYGIDPRPLYEEVGIDPDGPGDAGDRVSNKVLNSLWELAAERSGDPALGVKIGRRMTPSRVFVLGPARLARPTPGDAFERLNSD
jgi:hypothetical protein